MAGPDGLEFRLATSGDVAGIAGLLFDDVLGRAREEPSDLAPYLAAFREIEVDPNNMVIVASRDGLLVGCLQLTIIAGLSLNATRRAQIEAVRIAAAERSSGLGKKLIGYAIDMARDRHCGLVQLTSNSSREQALSFYQRCGFVASHTGFKMVL